MVEGEIFNPYDKLKGVLIPNSIVKNPLLTDKAKLCYGILRKYAGKDGKCYPSQKTISNDLGISEDYAKKIIRELSENNYILKDNPTMENRWKRFNNNYYFIWRKEFDDDIKDNLNTITEKSIITPSILSTVTQGSVSTPDPGVRFDPLIRSSFKSKEKEPESVNQRNFVPLDLPTLTVSTEPLVETVESVNLFNDKPILIKRKLNFPIEFEKPSRQRYNGEAMSIINYWNSSPGLSHYHLPPIINGHVGEPTKTFKQAYETVQKVLNGKFFTSFGLSSEDRIYTKDEIITAIDRFKLSATHPGYLPADKKCFKNIKLDNFFYNPYSNYTSSQFLKYLKEEPKLKSSVIKKEEEKNPQLTIWLKEFYVDKILLGGNKKFNPDEENKFIKGANLLHDRMRELQKRLNLLTGPREWCEIVINSLIDHWGIDKVPPGRVCSDHTYTDVLPIYMMKRGRLEKEESKVVYGRDPGPRY